MSLITDILGKLGPELLTRVGPVILNILEGLLTKANAKGGTVSADDLRAAIGQVHAHVDTAHRKLREQSSSD